MKLHYLLAMQTRLPRAWDAAQPLSRRAGDGADSDRDSGSPPRHPSPAPISSLTPRVQGQLLPQQPAPPFLCEAEVCRRGGSAYSVSLGCAQRRCRNRLLPGSQAVQRDGGPSSRKRVECGAVPRGAEREEAARCTVQLAVW